MEEILKISGVYKSYKKGELTFPVLTNVSLNICKGDFIAILGKSGSGKSTLLNVLGLLDDFDRGEYILKKQVIQTKSEALLSRLRNRHIGFIFQSYNLLAHKNAVENVALPLYYRRISLKEREHKAKRCLEILGMGNRLYHYPGELSGGECQRIAIARAIVGDPDVILADEPTGALDSVTAQNIISVLKELNNSGVSIILITHDEMVASSAKTIWTMQDGNILINDNYGA